MNEEHIRKLMAENRKLRQVVKALFHVIEVNLDIHDERYYEPLEDLIKKGKIK